MMSHALAIEFCSRMVATAINAFNEKRKPKYKGQ